MKLAVFARSLDASPTGRGMVAREVVSALRRVQPDVRIDLFAAVDPSWGGVTFHQGRGRTVAADTWLMLRGIGRELARIEPDGLWCPTHLLPHGVPAELPVVLTLLDVVWRDHPDTMTSPQRWFARYGERGLKRADRIVCISEFTRRRLIHYWPELASRARVVHLAPNSAFQRTRDGQPPVAPAGVVVNVDTIEPRKNLGVLLDAMADLPELRLVQCGGRGWKTGELATRAAQMPNVRLMGYADDQTVAGLYQTAAVAVFPTIYEGFHLPPLDAMALGCPVVASDIPVHREVLGDAATYFDPRNARALAAAIRRIVADPHERARMTARGHERAARYSWDATAKAIIDVVSDAQSERRKRRM
jgi:glycosyltransferase involved in cell wall biosynthesis